MFACCFPHAGAGGSGRAWRCVPSRLRCPGLAVVPPQPQHRCGNNTGVESMEGRTLYCLHMEYCFDTCAVQSAFRRRAREAPLLLHAHDTLSSRCSHSWSLQCKAAPTLHIDLGTCPPHNRRLRPTSPMHMTASSCCIPNDLGACPPTQSQDTSHPTPVTRSCTTAWTPNPPTPSSPTTPTMTYNPAPAWLRSQARPIHLAPHCAMAPMAMAATALAVAAAAAVQLGALLWWAVLSPGQLQERGARLRLRK